MECIISFISKYWEQIVFIMGMLITFYCYEKTRIEAEKCSLRNDILSIYDRCKDTKQITRYQLESIKYSSQLYFKLKGNSFIEEVVERIKTFELVD